MAGPGVYVTNLREVRRWFSTFEPDLARPLRESLKQSVVRTVVPRITSRVPHRTGRAAGSVRPRSGGNRMYVVAGGGRAPYFGWLDFGGTLRPSGGRHNTITRPRISRGRYVYPGIASSRRALIDDVSDTIARFIRVHH